MLTAHNRGKLRQQADQISIQLILNKPVEIAEIRQIVLKSLGQEA